VRADVRQDVMAFLSPPLLAVIQRNSRKEGRPGFYCPVKYRDPTLLDGIHGEAELKGQLAISQAVHRSQQKLLVGIPKV
jgi:hypothetical protein